MSVLRGHEDACFEASVSVINSRSFKLVSKLMESRSHVKSRGWIRYTGKRQPAPIHRAIYQTPWRWGDYWSVLVGAGMIVSPLEVYDNRILSLWLISCTSPRALLQWVKISCAPARNSAFLNLGISWNFSSKFLRRERVGGIKALCSMGLLGRDVKDVVVT